MSGHLAGRVALVSGAARGIGFAIATKLAEAGASVVVADSGVGIDGSGGDGALAVEAAALIGPKAAPFTGDLSDPAQCRAAVSFAVERFGGVDILVHAAAILRDGFIFKASADDWDKVIATNLSAAFHLMSSATPFMREQAKAGRGGPEGWGRIFTIVSSAGFYGNFGQAAYASAKAGLFGLTRVVAMDMARSGVTANAIAPFACTRVTEAIRPANEAQAVYKERAMAVPAAPVGGLVSALCGAAGAGITGQLFGVRGREIFLFSQPRPVGRYVLSSADWSGADGLPELADALGPGFASLETDLEAFNTDPVI